MMVKCHGLASSNEIFLRSMRISSCDCELCGL